MRMIIILSKYLLTAIVKCIIVNLKNVLKKTWTTQIKCKLRLFLKTILGFRFLIFNFFDFKFLKLWTFIKKIK